MIFSCKQCGKPMKRDKGHLLTFPPSRCDECRGMKQRHKPRTKGRRAAHILAQQGKRVIGA